MCDSICFQYADLTRFTIDEFYRLVLLVNEAFYAYLAEWWLDGKPRTTRKPSILYHLSPPDPRKSVIVYSCVSQNQSFAGRS